MGLDNHPVMQIKDLGEFGVIDMLNSMVVELRSGPGNGADLGFRLKVDTGDDTAAWQAGAGIELQEPGSGWIPALRRGAGVSPLHTCLLFQGVADLRCLGNASHVWILLSKYSHATFVSIPKRGILLADYPTPPFEEGLEGLEGLREYKSPPTTL